MVSNCKSVLLVSLYCGSYRMMAYWCITQGLLHLGNFLMIFIETSYMGVALANVYVSCFLVMAIVMYFLVFLEAFLKKRNTNLRFWLTVKVSMLYH